MKVTRTGSEVIIDGQGDLVISGRERALTVETTAEDPVPTTITKFHFVSRRPGEESKYRIVRLLGLIKLVWPYTK